MEQRKGIFIIFTMLAGLLLVFLVYRPDLSTGLTLGQAEKPPPPLSDQPFHLAFINEETCLQCHAEGRDLPAFGLTAPKIGHEPRANCVSCHQLPRQA